MTGQLESLLNKQKFHGRFDHVFLSSYSAHLLEKQENFARILSDSGRVSVENAVYVYSQETFESVGT